MAPRFLVGEIVKISYKRRFAWVRLDLETPLPIRSYEVIYLRSGSRAPLRLTPTEQWSRLTPTFGGPCYATTACR